MSPSSNCVVLQALSRLFLLFCSYDTVCGFAMMKSVSSNQSSVLRQCLPVIDELDWTVMRFFFLIRLIINWNIGQTEKLSRVSY